MNFDQAIYFSECLLRYFRDMFLDKKNFRDIFNVFFILSIARVKKYIENVKKIAVH